MRLVLAVPFLVAAGLILVCIVHYGVNTPFWDEWEMVPIFQKVDNHTVGFSDFWHQHNEHRIFFPNVVLTANAYLTRWNVKEELLINLVFSLITALMLYLFVLTKIKQRYLAGMAAVLIAAWFFSPVQYENWIWGWQVEWFMCVTGSVVTIYLLDRFANAKKKRRLLLGGATASAIIATFSLGNGILVWLIGLGILILYKQGKKPIITWLAAAAASTSAYYYHYHKPPNNPSTTLFLHQPKNFFQYIFGYFGRPVSSTPDLAMLTGSILLFLSIPLIYMVWLKRSKIDKFVPWLSLMALSLMAGFLTDVSRLGFGISQGLASRYTAFSLLYVIGLTGLICALLDTVKLNVNIKLFVVLVAFAVSGPLLFSSYRDGKIGFNVESSSVREISGCTHAPNPNDTCLLSTYPSTAAVKPRLEYLKTKHWAGY